MSPEYVLPMSPEDSVTYVPERFTILDYSIREVDLQHPRSNYNRFGNPDNDVMRLLVAHILGPSDQCEREAIRAFEGFNDDTGLELIQSTLKPIPIRLAR